MTAAVVWLCEQGLDIALVQLGAYQCEHDLVITVDQVWPLPQVEDFTVSPVAPTAKAAAASIRKRSGVTAVATLADGGVLDDGTELHIVLAGSHGPGVTAWVAEQPDRGHAVWRTGEKVRALEWPIDGQRYSASGLAEHIIRTATGAEASVNGAEWWALDDGTSLANWPARRRPDATGANSTPFWPRWAPESGPPTATSPKRSSPTPSPSVNTSNAARTARTPGGFSAPTADLARTSPGPTQPTPANPARPSKTKASRSPLPVQRTRRGVSGLTSSQLADKKLSRAPGQR